MRGIAYSSGMPSTQRKSVQVFPTLKRKTLTANNVVNRRRDALRESLVAQRRGICILRDDQLVDLFIECRCADPWLRTSMSIQQGKREVDLLVRAFPRLPGYQRLVLRRAALFVLPHRPG